MKKSTSLYLAACLFVYANFHAVAADLDWVRVGTSGKTIIFLFKDAQDEKGAEVNAISQSLHPTITINGTQKFSLTEAIYMDPKNPWKQDQALPYVIYPLFGTVLKAEDKVTVSAPDGWVTCGSGAVGAVQDVEVENYVGKSLLPPSPDKYTMPVGVNLSPEGWTNAAFRANLMREPSWYDGNVAVGANGLPTAVDDHTILHIRCRVDSVGDYTLLWDGGSQLKIINGNFKKTAETLTGGQDNKRVYTVTKESDWKGGRLDVQFLGTDVHNVRLYPPGIKTDGSQYFLPQFLQMVRGMRCLRYMQGMLFFGANLTRFDQLRSDEQEVQLPPIKVASADITSVEPYDNKDHFFINDKRDYFKITTAQPHHLQSGYTVKIFADATVPMTNGHSHQFQQHPVADGGMVDVISPTEFAMAYWDPDGHGTTAKEKQEITGTVTCEVERGDMWLSEVVDLVNSIDGCDLWINVPDMMEDDSVGKMFEYIGNRLKKGRKVHVEYSNETWNWGAPQCTYCFGMAGLDPDPTVKHWPLRWYTKRSIQVQTIAKEAFQKLGRQGDILGVIATQMGNDGPVDTILQYARDVHASFDEFAFAPYYDVGPDSNGAAAGGPYEEALDAITKKLDVDQVCDMADMNIQYGCPINRGMQMDVDDLKRYNFQGKLVCYEGGAEKAAFASEEKSQKIKISEGWADNPRIGPWMRCFFQRMQDDYGVSLFNYFTLDQGPGVPMWGVYPYRWDQVDGKGDGSDGLFDNLSDLQSDQCVSVKGYWIHDWLDHLNRENPPAP